MDKIGVIGEVAMVGSRTNTASRLAVRVGGVTAAVVLTGAALAACTGLTPPQPAGTSITGTVHPVAAEAAVREWRVSAWESGEGERAPERLGEAVTTVDGAFSVPLARTDVADGAVVYLLAEANSASDDAFTGDRPVLAGVIADAHARAEAGELGDVELTLNERSTVATGFAMAQFVGAGGVGGAAPGVVNSAGMAGNLVDPATGELGAVLMSSPNGSETDTLPAFVSLSGMLSACLTDGAHCAELLDAATAPGQERPVDTFRAFAAIAKAPAAAVQPLFDLAQAGQQPSQAGLADAPDAWTLALRFDGDGQSLDGPGNFAIDAEGNLWVNNNYQYNADPRTGVCSSDELFKFSPTGQFIDGSPYSGGGLSGSGFGVIVHPDTGDIWVSNYGFAAPAPGCPTDQQPPHNSMSVFTAAGEPLTGDTGITAGELNWPQGTIVDGQGTMWIANCNTSTVTAYPNSDPEQARVISGLGLNQAFDVVDNGTSIFVSGTASSSVAVLDPDGTPLPTSPLTGGGLDRPMGLATDATGTVWIANSGAITLPCPDRPEVGPPATGSVSYVDPSTGEIVGPFQGGGVSTPWGIATDGSGNVWVAEFSGQRVVAFCGTDPSTCPPGSATGDPLSPADTGYSFNGLDRSTGVAIDPSGNVWLTNNWLLEPIQTNPGGHEIVAFLGLATPVPGT